MATESELKAARYGAVEREADSIGRLVGVRRLRPSEQAKLIAMTHDLAMYEEVEEKDKDGNPTGNTAKMPARLPLQIAASVCEIDNVKIPFPKNRGELDSVYDRLDAEGLEAASTAFLRLVQSDGTPQDAKEEAKN